MPFPLTFGSLVALLWLAWLAYWAVSALATKPDARAETGLSRLAFGVPIWLAAWLMIGSGVPGTLNQRFVPASPGIAIVGTLLVAIGLGFAVWARVHLGANWSGMVTVKQDHKLIRSGPYGIVRHPIYSGLILAVLGSALVIGYWRAIVGFVLVVLGVVYKAGLEERWMIETFGQAYEDYRAKVPGLIPFLL